MSLTRAQTLSGSPYATSVSPKTKTSVVLAPSVSADTGAVATSMDAAATTLAISSARI